MVRLLLALTACSHGVSAPASSAFVDSCEPSALVRLGDHWLVGDNEVEDRLFVYAADMRPMPFRALPERVEDIEALVVSGAEVLVIGSHSRSKSGKARPDRRRVVRTTGPSFSLDLAACPACVAAEPLAPDSGGFNIEGAALAGPDLLLGLRSPLDAGRAQILVVSLGADAGHIQRVLSLDLGGAGVRDLVPFRGGFLLLAGPPADGNQPHTLWFLSGLDAVPERLPVSLPPSTEGVWALDDRHLRYVIDGSGESAPCPTPGRWADVEIPAGPTH